MKRWMRCLTVAAVAATLLGGCASMSAMKQARQAFGEAGKATAESKAPYEYYAAQEYLRMAEHEMQISDFKAAGEFAAKSEDFSRKALTKSGGGAR